MRKVADGFFEHCLVLTDDDLWRERLHAGAAALTQMPGQRPVRQDEVDGMGERAGVSRGNEEAVQAVRDNFDWTGWAAGADHWSSTSHRLNDHVWEPLPKGGKDKRVST